MGLGEFKASPRPRKKRMNQRADSGKAPLLPVSCNAEVLRSGRISPQVSYQWENFGILVSMLYAGLICSLDGGPRDL